MSRVKLKLHSKTNKQTSKQTNKSKKKKKKNIFKCHLNFKDKLIVHMPACMSLYGAPRLKIVTHPTWSTDNATLIPKM